MVFFLFLWSSLVIEVTSSPFWRPCVRSTGTKTINASETFELPIPMQVGPPGARNHMAWSFTLNSKDIFFLIEFQPASNPEVREVVSDRQLYLWSYGMIEGSVPILRNGVFFLVWDNSYSYFTSKTVNYRIGLRKEDFGLPSSWQVNVNVGLLSFFLASSLASLSSTRL